MRWHRSVRQVFALPAEALWPALCEPARWALWCGAVRAASGRVRPGGRVALRPSARSGGLHERTAPPMRVLRVEEGRRIVLSQPQPGGSTTLTWNLEEVPEGTRLELDLLVSGPLAAAALLAFEEFVRGFPADCARLVRLVREPQKPEHTVVIAGGSGTLGRAMATDLTCRGHSVALLTRHTRPELPFRQISWDGRTVTGWVDEFAEPQNISLVNLAGRLVDARPTAQNIADLRESRVGPTSALVRASHASKRPLARWIQASTTAIWSDAGEQRITESTPVPPIGLPQMTGVAQPWEMAAQQANSEQLTTLRTSIVLQPYSPALVRLSRMAAAGLAGPIGDGQQWFSWIHLQDWLSVVRCCLGLEKPQITAGVVIAAAPHPARNRDLMASLRRSAGRRFGLQTTPAMLNVGAFLMGTDPALALTGRHCTSEVLAEAGFEFAFPTLDAAIGDLLS